MAFVNNFSTSFRWWDRALNTDDRYRAYRARLQAAKKEAKAKGLTVEQMKELEDKMIQEAEEDGVKAEAEVESRAKWGGAKSFKLQ